jgi:hypothetical protein
LVVTRIALSDLSDLSAIGGRKNYLRRRCTEQQIQRAVFEQLKLRPASGIGGYRAPIEAKVLKSLGVMAAGRDLILIRGGRTYGLELKSEGVPLSAPHADAHCRGRSPESEIRGATENNWGCTK